MTAASQTAAAADTSSVVAAALAYAASGWAVFPVTAASRHSRRTASGRHHRPGRDPRVVGAPARRRRRGPDRPRVRLARPRRRRRGGRRHAAQNSNARAASFPKPSAPRRAVAGPISSFRHPELRVPKHGRPARTRTRHPRRRRLCGRTTFAAPVRAALRMGRRRPRTASWQRRPRGCSRTGATARRRRSVRRSPTASATPRSRVSADRCGGAGWTNPRSSPRSRSRTRPAASRRFPTPTSSGSPRASRDTTRHCSLPRADTKSLGPTTRPPKLVLPAVPELDDLAGLVRVAYLRAAARPRAPRHRRRPPGRARPGGPRLHPPRRRCRDPLRAGGGDEHRAQAALGARLATPTERR